MSMAEALIDVADLSRTHGGHVMVRDVTMRLLPGEMIALVGANGGGKTTTLRMLAGLLRPDTGSGQVLGEDVRKPGPDRRRHLGYMSQRLALYPELSVMDNLRFHGALHGIADPTLRIADIAARYGLCEVQQKPFGQLSGGWARRVQFAAAVLHAPTLLLLDEPTAGLDIPTRQSLWQWLGDLSRQGHGIVVSTHDPAEAAQCAKIMFYSEGRAHPHMTLPDMLRQTGTTTLEAAIMAITRGQAA